MESDLCRYEMMGNRVKMILKMIIRSATVCACVFDRSGNDPRAYDHQYLHHFLGFAHYSRGQSRLLTLYNGI
jgi:hypothetical protein